MQSRRDQVQAQSYVIGRLTSALVMAEPEALENPHRRVIVGHVVGVLVAALVVAGFVVYGFMRPGGDTSWRKPRTLIVEKDTGARYVLVGDSLRPVLNYTSAVLLLGGRPSVASVSSASLRSVPRGLPLGIVGAPDALPAASGLDGTQWTVCATGATATLSVERAGDAPVEERAVVVQGPDRNRYLVWQGRRHRLAEPWAAPVLGLDGAAATVPASWLDQLDPGPDLRGPDVPGRGEPGPVVDGVRARIGTVYVTRVAGTADRYYLLQRDGLSPLGPTALALTLGHPQTSTAYDNGRAEPVPMSAGALSQLPASSRTVVPDGTPPSVPALADPPADGAMWCVRRDETGTALVRGAVPDAPALPSKPPTGTVLGITRTDRTAAAVTAAAGAGGLARAGRPGQAPGADLFLVTDAGIKFPVPGGEAATALGYRGATPTLVDPALLDLLPTGPVLEPAAARR